MIRIHSASSLHGEVVMSGSKNAALPIVAASYLVDHDHELTNIPAISDINVLQAIHTDNLTNPRNGYYDLTSPQCRTIRSSILLIPYGLHRYGSVYVSTPGGCNLGKRPLDTFDNAFVQAGISISYHDEYKICTVAKAPARRIILQELSVTATEAIITYLAFHTARDYDVAIELIAIEPHVVDLITYLNKNGASITLGNNHNVTIHPPAQGPIYGQPHAIVGDYIETAFYMIAGAIVPNSKLTLRGVPHHHLYALYKECSKIGIDFRYYDEDVIEVTAANLTDYKATRVQTMIFPGLSTDMQAAFGVLLTQCHGVSKLDEPLYEGRFSYLDELTILGADIQILNPHQAIITGPTQLRGKKVQSHDLRGGSAMILAGLIAEGTTMVHNEEIIYRGYDSIHEKLQSIGAQVDTISPTT